MACCAAAAFIVMKMLTLHGTFRAHTDKITAQFGAETTATCRLQILGISCPACVESIESNLSLNPGVKDVKVSQTLSQAVVEYLPQDLAVAEIIAKIQDIGFEAERIVDDQDWIANIRTADEVKLREISEAQISLYTASSITLLILVIGLIPVRPGFYFSHQTQMLLQAILCGLVLIVCGRKIHFESFVALRRKSPDMSLLTSLGTSLAFISSVYDYWYWRNKNSVSDVSYASFESTAVLLCVVMGGRLLKSMVARRTLLSLSSLASLQTETAELVVGDLQDGERVTISVKDLQLGDRISVGPGSIVHSDGNIVCGNGYITETQVTGETLPIFKETGADVYAGSLILEGYLIVQITRKSPLGWLQYTIQLMSEGDAKRGSVQSLAEYLSARFSWYIILVAILTFAETSWIEWEPWSKALGRVTAIFLCACPCALGLASPAAIMVGLDLASRNGILIKGGSNCIEAAARIKTVFLDKTGTLTSGRLSVTECRLSPKWGTVENQRLGWWLAILAATSGSRHPVSKALTNEAHQKLREFCYTSEVAEVKTVENILGQGVKADIRLPSAVDVACTTMNVLVGNRALLQLNDIQDLPEMSMEDLNGENIKESLPFIDTYVAFDGNFVGLIRCADEVRADAAMMVRTLKSRGYNVGMLTGGDAAVAHSVARVVGIHHDWIFHDLLPQEKLAILVKTRDTHGAVAMVGDNLNDIQCMTLADFSVAAFVDTDSLTAVTADALLLSDQIDTKQPDSTHLGLIKIPYILELSKSIYRKIWLNLLWALTYNIVAVLLATGQFESYNVTLSPFYASLGMSFSSVLIVANAIKL